jgi:hypothetical protein
MLAATLAALTVAAGGMAFASDDPPPASWTAWEWYQDVALPPAGASSWVDFLLPPDVFDKAREDLADLRLVDAAGREVPYVLRVGRTHRAQRPLFGKEIGRERKEDRSAEVTLDLGKTPGEHREIDVVTGGDSFSRRVELQVSDDAEEWTAVEGVRWLNRQRVLSETIDDHRLRYPPGKQRYLRVRVFPDGAQRPDAPMISELVVYHSVEVPGETLTLPAAPGARAAVQTPDGPGSVWTINLGGDRMPCERLLLDVADEVFARSYYVEKVESGKDPVRIAHGQWRRSLLDTGPVEIQFSERTVRWLRLVVIDGEEPPLGITGVRFVAPARQVVFARGDDLAAPLRLYVGNPQAEKPVYDLAEELPAVIQPPPDRATLGKQTRNPRFGMEEDAAPAERRWVIYAVAGAVGLILLLLLVLLVRRPAGRGGPARRHR